AFISHVWRTICDAHPEWALDADSFKLRLAAAHRDGDLVLVNADLRDKKNMRDVEESAVRHQNMQWHCVQVVD
ncbi:MAG: hypothetical protein AAFQ35_14715, partial [Pseudomonadota bacterium]